MSFSIETLKPYEGEGIKCALFDFDGTVSLIREGWQQIMIPYFCEVIKELNTGEPEEEIINQVTEFVDRLTGKQTIYQCIALDEAVVKRGGKHREPLEYKTEYLRRLELKIRDKKAGLARGSISKESATVKGAVEFIELLNSKGIRCYLASGTDEKDVIAEARLLGVDRCFSGGIHGAVDGRTDCSKEAVIKHLLEEEHIAPRELAVFGDGFVEIQLVSQIGGYAVGVATDEKAGDGVDLWKRDRLISAGADMIIPHFGDFGKVAECLGI